jgi:ribosome-associated protein YbcJ (S4-like RNA binding protein)
VPASADRSSAAQPPRPVAVELPITLGQFLKVAGLAATGGEAKHLVVSGGVLVNGQAEKRRGRHLGPGDVVEVPGGPPVAVALSADHQ